MVIDRYTFAAIALAGALCCGLYVAVCVGDLRADERSLRHLRRLLLIMSIAGCLAGWSAVLMFAW